MHNENWDDLRYVLAVAETGSISGAARHLGVNHATVLRRIAAFETRHGASVFDRGPRGYSIRPDQLRVIQAAREAEAAMGAVGRLMRGRRAGLTGVVRVTSTDTFTQFVLPPVVAELGARERDLRIALLTSSAHVDFSRMHADITVRPAVALTEDLAGERAAELGFGLYAAPGAEGWLGLSGPLTRSVAGEWLEAHVSPGEIAATGDSFLALAALAARGVGQAILPCLIGEQTPGLTRIEGPEALPSVPIWVASHADLADVPRLRAVRTALAEGLAAMSETLKRG